MSNQQEEAGTGSGLAIRPVHAYIKTLGASGNPVAAGGSFVGQPRLQILDPNDGNADDDFPGRYSSSTGCTGFTLTPFGTVDAALIGVVVAWSITADDVDNLNTLMAAVDTDITTPGGSTALHGGSGIYVGFIARDVLAAAAGGWHGDAYSWAQGWDGTNPIKTITARGVGAAPVGLSLRVWEVS